MFEYHKINTVFKRDGETHKIIIDEYSIPEFEYLANNTWDFSEKMDGINIRIFWDWFAEKIQFRGRTDNAQIPGNLLNKLDEIFTKDKFKLYFPNVDVMLFGEGYGEKIQKNIYKINGVDFILFDVAINKWWLERDNIDKIAKNFNIKSVPIIDKGNINKAISIVSQGFNSSFGDFKAEGLVIRPSIELFSRNRQRIIAKLKIRDFN